MNAHCESSCEMLKLYFLHNAIMSCIKSSFFIMSSSVYSHILKIETSRNISSTSFPMSWAKKYKLPQSIPQTNKAIKYIFIFRSLIYIIYAYIGLPDNISHKTPNHNQDYQRQAMRITNHVCTVLRPEVTSHINARSPTRLKQPFVKIMQTCWYKLML